MNVKYLGVFPVAVQVSNWQNGSGFFPWGTVSRELDGKSRIMALPQRKGLDQYEK